MSAAIAATADHWRRVLFLRDYNTRVVLAGTVLLGLSAGVVGVFMLLRKRSLVGDVVGHASLPGIAVAFLALEARSPGSGRSLPALLTGALVAGLIGLGVTTAIRRWTRIREDAALAIVLSLFFGLGMVLFTVIQQIPSGSSAGLGQFIFGKAASMLEEDVRLIGGASAVVLLVCALLFKEFALLCFDEEFAAARGWPVVLLDLVLMSLVAGVSVIGLQSVGLLLVVALLITPAASARFWTNSLSKLALLAGLFGALGSLIGVLLSALIPRLATGAIIVLTGSGIFLVSLLVGSRGGVLRQWWSDRAQRQRIGRDDLLRAMYELIEPAAASPAASSANGSTQPLERVAHQPVALDRLSSMRAWTGRWLHSLISRATRGGLVRPVDASHVCLTHDGAALARRIVRNHRLWEVYLMTYADIAPADVDRAADQIEHVLEPELIEELESQLARRMPQLSVPPSPHALGEGRGK